MRKAKKFVNVMKPFVNCIVVFFSHYEFYFVDTWGTNIVEALDVLWTLSDAN